MDVFEPLAEVQDWAESQVIRRAISDPLARLAWRQVLDVVENFSEGCRKRNLVGEALQEWQEDRDWLIQEQDHPFSLEWCVETIRIRTNLKLSVSAIRQWAEKSDKSQRKISTRKAKIVPIEWLDSSWWGLASSS